MEAFPEALNCCVDVTRAFARERWEITEGSGFDRDTRDRMKAKETWSTVVGVCLAVLHAFGLLVTVCNHGRHRSLALAYEVAAGQGVELVSIRCPQRPGKLRPVRDFMEDVSLRLRLHVERFQHVPHPVAGLDVCDREFDGTEWGACCEGDDLYLVLHVGSILVNTRCDAEEAQGWRFGFPADGDTRRVPGWYPPSAVIPMPHRYFRRVDDLLASLVMTRSP